jgi:hypothetical protein
MLLTKEMSYVEFKGFFECLEKKITQKEFEVNILGKYQSTKKGITLKGKNFSFKGRVQGFLEGLDKIKWRRGNLEMAGSFGV